MNQIVIVGTDPSPERRALAHRLDLLTAALPGEATAADVQDAAGGPVETSIDASGAAEGRALALAALADFGRCAFVGEGGTVTFEPSPALIHRQVTLVGSWVTSLGHMAELLDRLDRWRIHPESLVTDRFPLAEAEAAYALADRGVAGKVCLVMH